MSQSLCHIDFGSENSVCAEFIESSPPLVHRTVEEKSERYQLWDFPFKTIFGFTEDPPQPTASASPSGELVSESIVCEIIRGRSKNIEGPLSNPINETFTPCS